MNNSFNQINPETEIRDTARVQPEEVYTEEEYLRDVEQAQGAEEPDAHLEAAYEARTEIEEPYDGGGWPGDGSGTDDLADYNANEANDYFGE